MNLFGTDGVRAKVGAFPFTPEALPRLGKAIALWALEKYGPDAHILIGADTRYSRHWVKASLSSGLLEYPLTVGDAGMLSTPAVFQLLQINPRYHCGIIISASHNPSYDNGIKLVDAQTGKLTHNDEERITALFENPLAPIDYEKLGSEEALLDAQEQYIKKIIALFKPNFLKDLLLVLDCAHGATSPLARPIFEALGAQTIILNDKPDGFNINENCGALHPEMLQKTVLEHKAFAGFAFDGDGDRVIAVNKNGDSRDGDEMLAILLNHPDYKNLPAVVSTVMANQGFEHFLHSRGKKLIRTAVGDKNINEALVQYSLTLGGEPSGHILLPSVCGSGDGIVVALKILETMLITGNIMMDSFTKFPQIVINVPISKKRELHEPPLSDIIEKAQQHIQEGRILVRYSGTEPLVRVMVEAQDETVMHEVAQKLANELRAILQ